MKAQIAVQAQLFRAQAGNNPAAARAAVIAGQVDQFQRANPYATVADTANAQKGFQAQSTNALRQTTLSAHQSLDPAAHRAAAQAELDDLAQVSDAENRLVLTREDVSRRQTQIDQDYRRGQIDNLMATRTFTGGAEAALLDYANRASDTASQAAQVVGNAFKSLENGMVGFITGTKTARQAVTEMAASIAEDITRMAVRSSITGPLASLLGMGVGGGGGAGLFGSLFSSSSGPDPTVGGGGIGDLFSGMFHDGGIIGRDGSPRQANPAWWIGAPRYHAGGIVGLSPDEVPIIARKGERVQTEAQQASGTSGPVTVIMNITTQDAASFRASQGQIAAQMAQAVTRGRRNL